MALREHYQKTQYLICRANSIAVAVYQNRNEEYPTEGWIDFWELKNEKLLYSGEQLKVTRGVHTY